MKTKILIVEDEIIIASDIKEQLEKLDYSVIGIATSGEQAVGYAKKETPDVILMDIKLSGKMNGIEAANIIRSFLDIPIIFISSYSDDKIIQQAKVAGPFGYLIKPIADERELHVNIQIALHKAMVEKEFLKVKKFEALSILSGGIAHDFNNILTAILGRICLLIEMTDSNSKNYLLLDATKESCITMSKLIKQLMTITKWNTLNKKKTSIQDIINDITLSVLEDSNVSYNFFPSKDLCLVELDIIQMNQAFKNIITNSIEAMPDGGKIEIYAENVVIEKDKFVKISIKDNGIGIDEKHLNQIFDPYFSTKQRAVQKGMGLGLSVAYAIVKKHGGNITIESKNGIGTTCNIYLPIWINL